MLSIRQSTTEKLGNRHSSYTAVSCSISVAGRGRREGPAAATYNLSMSSRTSSRYRTAVTEPRLKMCRSVWHPNEIPAHTIMLRLGMRDVR
ncbi:hypothetical protein TNCV_2743931 [Trichonephila clavipes]|nr:hypothetical protein TNCV_2743931 [Trichonephila clavipes]